jgi:hypothetical protein
MEYWNGGKMEYWGSKADHGLILFSGPRRLYKNRPQSAKPIIPSFQYSIILQWMSTAQPIFSNLLQ